MKKTLSIIFISLITAGAISSCKKSSFDEAYRDPSKVSGSTVEKQYAGMISSITGYVLPSYWNYFVVLRTSVNRYTQSVGWENGPGQYQPPAAGLTDRWNSFYNFLAQYREVQKLYNALPDAEKQEKRIYMLTGAIYFYDQTQRVVDLHGDIPWAEAGLLSTNNGNFGISYAKYQSAQDIYTTMLDDLKAFSDELNDISLSPGVATVFATQDLVNRGDLDMWKKYCNSLRLRMLTRISSTSFKARYDQEVAEILGNPSKYPIINNNDENIMIRVRDLVNGGINGSGFQSGLEDWNGNIAGKAMIDHMKENADPRLRAIFEPGENANGQYNGLGTLLNGGDQTNAINSGTLSIYNRSTITRNHYFPGILITASEVNFLVSEYYLGAGNNANAENAYNAGIRNSIDFYYWVRSISNNNTSPALTPTNDNEVNAYLNSLGVRWSGTTDKIRLIGTQKWLHFNVVQPLENWSEMRRLDEPTLAFQPDNSSPITSPPNRWVYPAAELAYNTENYKAVQANDNATNKIFWDTK
jgi:hypothetical protein